MARRLRPGWCLAAALVLLSGCGPLAVDAPACIPPDHALSGTLDGLYVLPDDGRAPVLDEIDRATCTIDVTIYLLSDDATIEALIRAESRGVRVRILYEAAPFGGGVGIVEATEALASSGIELRTGPDRFRFVHAKYLVVDGQVAIVTNQNLTNSAFESNRELGVVTTDPDDVAALAAIFEADWTDATPSAPSDRLIVSPQNARPRLLDLIDSAEGEVRLYAEVIRDDGIVDALSSAAQRGVQVRVLVNEPDDDLDRAVYSVLTSNGVELRAAGGLYIHAKALVVDDRVVVVGSQNPTATSLDDNREVSLVLEDPTAIARAMAVFELDWSRGAPWPGPDSGVSRSQPVALDMYVVYGYDVRTVPRGLTRITGQRDRVPELRGDGANMIHGWPGMVTDRFPLRGVESEHTFWIRRRSAGLSFSGSTRTSEPGGSIGPPGSLPLSA